MYQRWVDAGYFTADVTSDKPSYSIVIPPPNVTGNLHIGHAFEHTLIDILVRRRRMQGYETLWLPGMDHASIAVHALVERALEAEGTSRRELGREAFIERTWEWKAQYGGAILAQMRRLGESVDWSRERFTMDEGLNRAVVTIFKRLYDDGLIYRAERMVNWSPEMRSVLSDIEVEHHDVEGELVSIRYGDGDDSVVVATTRVETMLGDTAIAVHPDDERYAHLVGREIELPLVGRMIKVVGDEHVDPSFGTGALKITPAHDPNDFEIGRRHGLPMPTIMDESGRIAGTGTEFDGLDRYEARVKVREALARQGRIVAEKRPYLHSVGHSQRTREPIEPRLSLQWFVKAGPLAAAAGDAVRDGRVAVHPKELEPRWFGWVDNMHDWCISRQLWWGHRIPVWYSPDGEVVCLGPDDEPPAGWTQDEDVLDTWFSSALWPFSTLGWPEKTPDLERFYPNSVLVTGYDILFFWVARMMMFGLYANADRGPAEAIPFHTIALHGMVRDQNGKKMSKSAGNTVDPQDWMDRFGTDALRFALARAANPGTDAPIGEDNVAAARNFGTKLWNATRFALANGASPALPLPTAPHGSAPTDADAWILGRLRAVREQTDALLGGLPVRQGRRGALPVHLGRVLLLVPGAGQAAAGRSNHRGWHPGRARARAGRAAAAAAPGDPVPHRGALPGAHRARVGGDRAMADRGGPGHRPGRRRPGGRAAEADHRDPPVPHRAAGAGQPPGGRPPGRAGPSRLRLRAGRGTRGDRVAGPAGRAGRRLRADGHSGGRAGGRLGARRAGHLRRDRRGRGEGPARS